MNKQEALDRLTSLENEAKELRKIIEEPEVKKPIPEELFSEMTTGLIVHLDDNYPNSVFFIKNGEVWFELDSKNKYLWCKSSTVWSVLEKEYSHKYNDVQSFIKNQVEERYKLNGFTPGFSSRMMSPVVEERYKLKGFTPENKNSQQ